MAGPGPADLCGIGIECAMVSDSIGESFSNEAIRVSSKSVPEPGPLALLGIGLITMGFVRKKKFN